jgi:hypothetical protein
MAILPQLHQQSGASPRGKLPCVLTRLSTVAESVCVPVWRWIYFRWFGAFFRFRAAHRAFIISESLFRPAAVSPPFRFGCAAVAIGVFPRLRLAHRARCAAAILARAAGDMLRRRDRFREVDCGALGEVLKRAVRRASKLSICRRICTASSSDLRDRFMESGL